MGIPHASSGHFNDETHWANPLTIAHDFTNFGKKTSQGERNGANFSFIASSSAE